MKVSTKLILIVLTAFLVVSTVHGCLTYRLTKRVDNLIDYHQRENKIDDDQIAAINESLKENSNDLKLVKSEFDNLQPINTTIEKVYQAPKVELPNYNKEFDKLLLMIEQNKAVEAAEPTKEVNLSNIKENIFLLRALHQRTIDSFKVVLNAANYCLDTNRIVKKFKTANAEFAVHTKLSNNNITEQYINGFNIIGIDVYKKNAFGLYISGQTSIDKFTLFDDTFLRYGLFYRRRKTQFMIGTGNGIKLVDIGIAKTLFEW